MNNKDVVFFNLFLAFIFQTVLDLPFREPSFSTLFTIYVWRGSSYLFKTHRE